MEPLKLTEADVGRVVYGAVEDLFPDTPEEFFDLTEEECEKWVQQFDTAHVVVLTRNEDRQESIGVVVLRSYISKAGKVSCWAVDEGFYPTQLDAIQAGIEINRKYAESTLGAIDKLIAIMKRKKL